MDQSELIITLTKEIVGKMIDSPEISVEQDGEMYHVNISVGDEAPTIIGRHGETIRALQKILEVILFKQTGENLNVLVNVNDYRQKQTERLEHIASEVANKTRDTGSPSYLRGFSSYERRIIHSYITDNYSDLSTYSIGEGRDRRLVVDLKTGGDQEESIEE